MLLCLLLMLVQRGRLLLMDLHLVLGAWQLVGKASTAALLMVRLPIWQVGKMMKRSPKMGPVKMAQQRERRVCHQFHLTNQKAVPPLSPLAPAGGSARARSKLIMPRCHFPATLSVTAPVSNAPALPCSRPHQPARKANPLQVVDPNTLLRMVPITWASNHPALLPLQTMTDSSRLLPSLQTPPTLCRCPEREPQVRLAMSPTPARTLSLL